MADTLRWPPRAVMSSSWLEGKMWVTSNQGSGKVMDVIHLITLFYKYIHTAYIIYDTLFSIHMYTIRYLYLYTYTHHLHVHIHMCTCADSRFASHVLKEGKLHAVNCGWRLEVWGPWLLSAGQGPWGIGGCFRWFGRAVDLEARNILWPIRTPPLSLGH